MRAVWLGLFGFSIGWLFMYFMLASDPFRFDNPLRLTVAVAFGVVCGGVGWTAAYSQRPR